MKKKIRNILACIFFIINSSLLIINSASAQDPSHIRISLLTCTPGTELYSTFGHSAFRVTDSSSVTDLVYNYGTFNFDDEGFYLKFMRGKLLYYVAVERFDDFKADYQYQGRGITEQALDLTAEEKVEMQHFLNENIKDENKYYRYDFFFDNCTTRLRDILKKQVDSNFCSKEVMPHGTSFRQAIQQYLDKNDQPWSKLGIDILLGKPCDAVMTAEQMQFLPDNLMKSLDSSINKMVLIHQDLYKINTVIEKTIFTPFVFFSILSISIFLISSLKNRFAKRSINIFDAMFFFLTGSLGILLIIMWTATDHTMCKDNLNLLWAWPIHAVMAFFINSKKNWVKIYLSFTAIAMLVLLSVWAFLPQQMNNGLIPIVSLLAYRSAKKAWFTN